MFGLGYDKSLSIILTNDDEKRKIIIDFIKSIPKKLYVDLLNKIGSVTKDTYYREISVNGIIYFYQIDNNDKCITIGSYMKENSYNNNIFLLKLYPYNEVEQINGSLHLGNVIYQYKEPDENSINICDIVEYGLEKKTLGINFIKTYGYRLLFNKITKRILIDNSLSFDELFSFEQEKSCLIRKLLNNFGRKIRF